MSIYVLGIDPGSTGDRTGLCVVRRDREATALQMATAMRGIKMTEIVAAAMALIRSLDQSLPDRDRIAVVIDRTGIGLGPSEELQRALKIAKKDGTLSRRVVFKAVHVVAGDGVTVDEKDPSRVSVGRDLLYERGLQAVREGTLTLSTAEGDAVEILAEEMKGLVVTYSGTRRTGRTDHGKGKNDDVVFSMLLAYWLAAQTGFGGHSGIGGTIKAMAKTLTGGLLQRSSDRAPAPAPRPTAQPTAPTVWTHAALLQVVRRESLLVPGAVNMTAAALLQAVNASLVASGRSALPGAVADPTKHAPAPNGTWSSRLG